MNVGILNILKEESVSSVPGFTDGAVRLLELKGHAVKFVLTVAADHFLRDTAGYCGTDADALIVAGDVDAFRQSLAEKYTVSNELPCFEIENVIYLLDPTLNAEFINETAIPALNSKSKSFYNTCTFKTFGADIDGVKTRLADCVRNKNRISFGFVACAPLECEVRMCFSNKTNDVDVMAARVAELLKDCLYSTADETLAGAVVNLLKRRGKTVCTAESFTGGGLIGALIAVPGASAVVKEGIVAYANESKIKRLNVEPQIIDHYGAVSIETAYEMAANILLDNDCDYVAATTGNAGPSAEKEGGQGLFFVAVGDRKGIHIYKEVRKGDRAAVTEAGIKTALFRLYQKLAETPES